MSEMSIHSLDTLPPELLQKIFGKLPAHYCLSTISRVCPLFYRLINDDNWWNGRKKEINLEVHPKEEETEEFSLQRVICRSEIEETRWRSLSEQKMHLISAHYGAINSCKLYAESNGGRRCISAGRDRTIRLWDLDRIVMDYESINGEEEGESTISNVEATNKSGGKEMLHSVDVAHSGWIWVVTRPNSSNITYSCGWDNYVKRWQITPTSMKESGHLNLGSAVVGLDWIDGSENELVASTFLRRVCLLDVRDDKMECTNEHTEHRNAVIGVVSRGNYVYSCGEDRLVVLSDRRNLSTHVAKTTIPRSYAGQLSIGPTSLVVGSQKGECFYLDPMNLEMWGSFNVQSVCEGTANGGKSDPLRGIINTGHSIVTLSKYGKLNALSYGLKPRSLIDSLKLEGEPSRLDYLNDDVVVSMGDGRIAYWSKPRI